jgi:hypothetical protein
MKATASHDPSRTKRGEPAPAPYADAGAQGQPLSLHRAVGNQAIQRLVRASLPVVPAHDPLEAEADRVAAGGRCACGGVIGADGVCDRCRARGLALKRVDGSAGLARAPAHVVARAFGGGAPLDGTTRSAMETRVGHDLSGVRVHTDPAADRAARALGARAFTVGADIAFAEGEFAPHTEGGRRLLAHELAHVAQQMSGRTDGPVVQRQPQGTQPPPAGPGGQPTTTFGARPLSDDEVLALTGVPASQLPENTVVPVDEASAAPVVLGGAMVGTPMPAYPIAPGSTGIFVHPEHVAIFAQQRVNPVASAYGFDIAGLTSRGFRSTLWQHWRAREYGTPASAEMYSGTPGAFRQDLVFPLDPSSNVTAVSRIVGDERAARFADQLRATEYAETYRRSPPPPGSADYMRVYGVRDGATVCIATNCVTVPAAQIEAAIGIRPELVREGVALDIMTGRTTPGGAIDVGEAGHMARMREWAERPGEQFTDEGLTRMPLPRGQMLVRPAVGVIRVGGTVMLIYGGYQTYEHLKSTWGTPEFGPAVGEEAGSWGGGLMGSAIGGATAAGIACAPLGPVDLVCIAAGFLGGLIGSTIGSYIGRPIGRALGAFPSYVWSNVVGGFVAIDLDPLLDDLRKGVAEIDRTYAVEVDVHLELPANDFAPDSDTRVAALKGALRPLHEGVYDTSRTLEAAAGRIAAIGRRLRSEDLPKLELETIRMMLEHGRYYPSDSTTLDNIATNMESAAVKLKVIVAHLLPQRAEIIEEESHNVMKK